MKFMLDTVRAQAPDAAQLPETAARPKQPQDDIEDYVRERCGEIDEVLERADAIREVIDADK
jgi:hypothetical protein